MMQMMIITDWMICVPQKRIFFLISLKFSQNIYKDRSIIIFTRVSEIYIYIIRD